MKPQEINEALAKHMGYKEYFHDGHQMQWAEPGIDGQNFSELHVGDIPNYYGDLNAVAEVEKTLNLDQRADYVTRLWPQGYGPMEAIGASSQKKTEMLLRTLNLWQE